MALSNRDRIGRMLELLSPELDSFIQRVVEPELTEGADWTMLVALRDHGKGITGKEYGRTDPQVQLRMLTENITSQVKHGWYPFSDHLSPAQKSFASELRDVRDSWAHHKAFTADDTYRALDTAERLLRAIAAPQAADDIEALRKDLRRVTAEADDRRTLKNVVINATTVGLQPWRDVLEPHEDVATGNFRASEFAADLYKVAAGDPDQSRDYTDPAEFFARTYLTDGLRDLLGRAVARLGRDPNASPVINLQTNFGGGKTHSMLSLWHLASGTPLTAYPQDVQELLSSSGFDAAQHVNRVAIVGNHLAPTGATKPDGTKVNTLWGEMAWQLGGAQAFAIVAESDRTSTPPGHALHDLLAAYAPAVILIDEWVAYARVLYDRDDLAAGTFDTQFTFAQALTEAVKATPGVLVAISIPASHDPDVERQAGSGEEVGGANGQEALRRLQNVVRRVADQWQPASSEEAYHIVRQRLFVEPDGAALAVIGATAREFVAMYRRHSADFPRESRDPDYEERIKRSYPIHPELFDRLYEDWSTLERFQRTRGVLRLMNTVIHALWQAGDASPLILPGSIPLSTPGVNSELTQYLSDSWKPIIDADVDGEHSVPGAIDQEKSVFGQRSLTKRLARTVFFGAAPTIGTAHVGLETARVFLGTAVPGDVPGNFHSALNQLSDKATYFYSGAGKHWYDTQANITRRARDQAERLGDADVWAEIARRLRAQPSGNAFFTRVHVAPEDSADIPDTDSVSLVVVHPGVSYSRKAGAESSAVAFARAATERRGSAQRQHRNMVVFLAGDQDRLDELSTAVREYLGWKHVHDQAHDLDLSPAQLKQATERRDRADQTAGDRLLGAYHWVLAPEGQPFELTAIKAEGQGTSLAGRVARKLVNEGALEDEHVARVIRLQLDALRSTLWKHGHVSVRDLWHLYTTYPYMPRLRDRSVLDEGVRSTMGMPAWELSGFAVAESYDEQTDGYHGLVLPTDTGSFGVHDGLLLVEPDRAWAQREAELAASARERAASDPDATGKPSEAVRLPGDVVVDESPGTRTSADPPRRTRFFGVRSLSRDRYAGDFKKVVDEVLAPLAGVEGVSLSVRIEIEATTPAGFSDDKVRTVRENATTLRFDAHSFEED